MSTRMKQVWTTLLSLGTSTMALPAVGPSRSAASIGQDEVSESAARERLQRVTYVSAPCPADLTADGIVNASDLAVLLGSWGACSGCPADLNSNDAVGVEDLALLLGAWGVCSPPCPPQCPADGIIMTEVCGDEDFGGCSSFPWTMLSCGDTVCGTAWAEGQTRDVDFWLVALPDPDGDGLETLSTELISDSAGCSGSTSTVSAKVKAGQCYKIRVGGAQPGDIGSGTLTVSCQ